MRVAGLPWVGATLRGVRGRMDTIQSDILPELAGLEGRADATQSRPYPMMHPNKKAAW